ncbi:MAG: 50S ribosomal protein L22 [Candidatus Magasanikbacteria bacterium CG11_big_fil_rev_8_21_14_0_20_39_34]|uniref:Large ribosomal subunit protein uL22 n=1 Tax=Candidatus Magasanikbacteria bacterium CG11_big_fil_rev_8_21_14_0_20_39_34 TaxID=1974653 RepID=A0A2H0N623_9BACT|nr:MAG: 50S ribosomal protein L22 [Candidatus Magasanikbacteria bacterium CG11_big_fil_rev_8_21_14_0_20_39_34]
MNNSATAKLRNLRMSPRKVRLIAGLIRGRKVTDALVQLQFSPKAAARPVKKLLDSAIANAMHNHSLNMDSLVVKEIRVDEGKTLYRWMPRALGRATPLRKRMSHISLTIEGEIDESKKKEKVKKETKKKSVDTSVEEVKGEKMPEESPKKAKKTPAKKKVEKSEK